MQKSRVMVLFGMLLLGTLVYAAPLTRAQDLEVLQGQGQGGQGQGATNDTRGRGQGGSARWNFAVERNVTGNSYQAQVPQGEAHGYQFGNQNQVRMNFNASVPMQLQMHVNDTGMNQSEFGLHVVNTPSGNAIRLNVSAQATMGQINLTNGRTITIGNQSQNRHRYRYEHNFAINVTTNGSCTANLYHNVNGNPNATWAYYNETTGQWEVVPSSLDGDYLQAQVNHFSTYAILTQLPDETSGTTGGDIGHPAMWFGLVGGMALAVLALKRKHARRA